MSVDFDIDFEDYGEHAPKPDTGAMLRLAELVEQAAAVEAGIEKMKQRLASGEALLEDLLERQIPELMESCGQKRCTTLTGLEVVVELKDFANVPAPTTIEKTRDPERREELLQRRMEALRYIDAEAPSLIKREISVMFGRGQEADAKKFTEDLMKRRNPVKFNERETVDNRTLMKWVKEMKDAGKPVNEKLLGVCSKRVAKVRKVS
jgi:ferredoxin